jgi:hypothetical protein
MPRSSRLRSLVRAISFGMDGIVRLRCWSPCSIRERGSFPLERQYTL